MFNKQMLQPENVRSDRNDTEKTPYQITETNEKERERVYENVNNLPDKSPTRSEQAIREMYQ